MPKKKMLINALEAEESRVAIVVDGVLQEFGLQTCTKEQIKGNIYKGVVVKVEPSLQAAFVDYGGQRAGFLPLDEVHPQYYPEGIGKGTKRRKVRIQDVLQKNQHLLVQVVKEEIGSKGAGLSTYISLPGRYLVLMPGNDKTGVSRKIEDEAQRKRLKEIVSQLAPPAGMGVIVRTAGEKRKKSELARDLNYLLRLWESIQEKSQAQPAPSLIYQESDLVIQTIRDYFTPDIEEVLVDNREIYRKAKEFFRQVMPHYQRRVKLYRERRPIFSKYQLEEQIETIYQNRVTLKSGAYLVIDPTEALVAIDVNSGRSTKEKDVEETAFRTNLEAAEEIARQLRLRDLGGLVVIDFIDMKEQKHRREVEKVLKNALKEDKARVKLSRISSFGLLELSRQRLRSAIVEGTFRPCPYCEGSGMVKSTVSFALSILRKMQAGAVRGNTIAIKAVLPLDVATYLLNQKREALLNLERTYHLSIYVTAHPGMTSNAYELEFIKKESTEKESKGKKESPAPLQPTENGQGEAVQVVKQLVLYTEDEIKKPQGADADQISAPAEPPLDPTPLDEEREEVKG
ncbi:MAG: ribonuclease E/G [Nitrospinota bacterium]|nr:MAG: ribonuclease E/G [Nitrospinota bacterium]